MVLEILFVKRSWSSSGGHNAPAPKVNEKFSVRPTSFVNDPEGPRFPAIVSQPVATDNTSYRSDSHSATFQ